MKIKLEKNLKIINLFIGHTGNYKFIFLLKD